MKREENGVKCKRKRKKGKEKGRKGGKKRKWKVNG
jgi:hypothetical protein